MQLHTHNLLQNLLLNKMRDKRSDIAVNASAHIEILLWGCIVLPNSTQVVRNDMAYR